MARPEMAAYVAERAPRPDPVLAALAERTRAETGDASGMQVSAFQGAVLTMLTRLVGARRALELGTFTGYSSICIARGLAGGGSLLCCDVERGVHRHRSRHLAEAGVDDRIELRIAPALDTLASLEREVGAEPFDLVFIDANKGNYPAYVDAVALLMRPGGLLLVDNTLWSGRVLEPASDDADHRHVPGVL